MTQPKVGNDIRIFTDGIRPKQAYVDLVLDRD